MKDIQKEQLKITLWNEEVLLENVQLILEAFDYLQLPFALKQGQVGRLSIKIPWKKLGWDPIIIILEDVFISACKRDDQEWSLDAVERREFAAKKAKLAAAELAKLSRRVSGNQTGQSFISYITAKILDGIQVSIRNVHVLYRDMLSETIENLIGLRFSSLTIMKHNPVGSSVGKGKGGQVNKVVEILGLEIYCSTFQGTLSLVCVDNIGNSMTKDIPMDDHNNSDYILAPFDLSLSLKVNRSGRLENDAPQYSITADLTSLVVSVDETQLQQLLTLWDYLCIYQVREKYGRYRPWFSPLSRKLKGWQKVWWHYAQEAVHSDVRKKLRKTSWRYLGQRLSYQRKYVNLYKDKLNLLRQEQPIDEEILCKLEQMEKESDIDDILSYRSTAEHELQCKQESSLNSSTSIVRMNSVNAMEKLHNDERSLGRSRGWLKWQSRGMLGAGGTDDSSQFSGVVSDEVIKDIYEATKFHPQPTSDGDANDNINLSIVKFSIRQISAVMRRMKYNQEIAMLTFTGVAIETRVWEESTSIIAVVESAEMVYPCTKQVILLTRRAFNGTRLENECPTISVQVDASSRNRADGISVKIRIQQLEVNYDPEFLLKLMVFYNILESFTFQYERVLLSLDGIGNTEARLLSKAQYILSSRIEVVWDISLYNIIVNIPWRDERLDSCNLVFSLQISRINLMS